MVVSEKEYSSLDEIVGHKEKLGEECDYMSQPNNYIRPLKIVEQETIQNAIRLCKGNIAKAAVYLDIAPSTLYRKLKKWEEKTLANEKQDE